jgi:hypothetical protein
MTVMTPRRLPTGDIKGADEAAHKRAECAMNHLLTRADEQRSPTSSVRMGCAELVAVDE